jgi:hypothetical protein
MNEQLEHQTLKLLARINELELEQKDARERINDLMLTKKRLQETLAKICVEKDEIVERQHNNELLQQQLHQIIERKEAEEHILREKIQKMRRETDREIALLRLERDKAIEFANNRQQAVQLNDVYDEYKWLMIGAIVMTLFIGVVSIVWLLQ